MRNWIMITGVALTLSACAQKSAYEAAVEDFEPNYCYQSIGGVSCYATPYARDERRLVNYYGPAPIRYDKAEPEPAQTLAAPKSISYWVKDPEPRPSVSASSIGLNAFMRNIDQNSKAPAVE